MLFKTIIFLFSCNVLFIDSIDVNTSSGVVRGQTINVLGVNVDQFLGIPFAEPPIGSLRFARPRPIQTPIKGVIDATKPKNSCIQLTLNLNLKESEDCLFLNIWSAQPGNTISTKLKPVMFWIHGGGPVGTSFNFPENNGTILATNGVVLVTTNFRLGPFGFLFGGTEDAPGNLALYDQLLALKWVRENIHLFGGDKNEITLFGESSGSFLLSAHILSPLSRGLFRRAITESGADFHGKRRGVTTPSKALANAKTMAKLFLCFDDRTWLDCLRRVPAVALNLYPGYLLNFFPVDGTEFVPLFAQEAFKQGLYNQDIDLLAGVTKDDGSLFFAFFPPLQFPIQTELQFNIYVGITDGIFHDIDGNRVRQFYLDTIDKGNSSAVRQTFIDFFGDIALKCPTYQFAKHFAQNTQNRSTYFYELTYRAEDSPCKPEEGICHGADLPFVFGAPILTNSASNVDIDFSHEVIQMWTNFAKTGNPGNNWPRFTGESPIKVKNLNPFDNNAVFTDLFSKTCDDFWNNYFN